MHSCSDICPKKNITFDAIVMYFGRMSRTRTLLSSFRNRYHFILVATGRDERLGGRFDDDHFCRLATLSPVYLHVPFVL